MSGNTVPLSGLNCTLSGISTAGIWPPVRTGTASATASFAKKADNVWTAGLYVFGFSPAAENILAVEVLMKEEDSVFNERQSVDLTPYLRGFDGDEISLEAGPAHRQGTGDWRAGHHPGLGGHPRNGISIRL